MSRNIWVISDTHWNHANIIRYSNRPFDSVYHMNQAMETHWNETVKDGDIVYHLGDVYMGLKDDGTVTRSKNSCITNLKGRKRLILGNHDNGKDQNLLRVFQKVGIWRMFTEFGLLLTHVPVHPQSFGEKVQRNVHGHTHCNLVMTNYVSGDAFCKTPDRRYKNVCVEHTNYKPVNIEELRVK